MRAWHRADAAADKAERTQARREAEQYSALAQDVGTYREALTEITEARRRWHAATEVDRQRALMADGELRRRYPGVDLPPLHACEEAPVPEPDAEPIPAGPDTSEAEGDARSASDGPDTVRRDVTSALAAARRAKQILAVRSQTGLGSDDVVRQREAEALQEAAVRRSAVRQDPAPSRRTMSLELDEPELEAGQ